MLHNAKGAPRGLLCINFDRSPLDGMIDLLVRFAAPVEDRPAELFDKDWREQILLVVDEECRSRRLRRERLTREQRLDLVRVLDERGLFATRNAAAHAAEGPGRLPHHRLRLAQGGTLMKPLRTFRLEEYLGEWEFKVRYHLTASDAQSMTIEELLALGTEAEEAADREGLMKLPLSYIETWGTPELRQAVAGTYEQVDADHVLPFAGAEEALFWAMQELAGPGDHAVVTVPCYQAMETVTLATGADVSALVPRREDGWALDLDDLRGLLRPNTKLVAVNYPHNPTGYVPDEATFRELVALCDERGIRLFCDEVYRGIEIDPARTLPQAADLSETAVSLNVASKAYGLPGLRIGWLACRDRALLERLEKRKHYTSICNAGPAEYLAAVALRHREAIWSATGASSPPTARCSTSSSPAGPTSSTGCRRWAAASASPGTRAATWRSSAGSCWTPRASWSCRRACTRPRSPTRCPWTTSASGSAGSASMRASPPSTASCASAAGAEQNSLQDLVFGHSLSASLLRLPPA